MFCVKYAQENLDIKFCLDLQDLPEPYNVNECSEFPQKEKILIFSILSARKLRPSSLCSIILNFCITFSRKIC